MVEMGENRTPRPEHVPRELPTGISGLLALRCAGPRPAGCFARYPVMPLGSLTSLTGVGDAAPPLMTSSPSGEGGRRRCSLPKQRGRNCRCQLQACSLFYEACEQPRPAIPGSRALSKPDIPTNRSDAQFIRPMRRSEHPFDAGWPGPRSISRPGRPKAARPGGGPRHDRRRRAPSGPASRRGPRG